MQINSKPWPDYATEKMLCGTQAAPSSCKKACGQVTCFGERKNSRAGLSARLLLLLLSETTLALQTKCNIMQLCLHCAYFAVFGILVYLCGRSKQLWMFKKLSGKTKRKNKNKSPHILALRQCILCEYMSLYSNSVGEQPLWLSLLTSRGSIQVMSPNETNLKRSGETLVRVKACVLPCRRSYNVRSVTKPRL